MLSKHLGLRSREKLSILQRGMSLQTLTLLQDLYPRGLGSKTDLEVLCEFKCALLDSHFILPASSSSSLNSILTTGYGMNYNTYGSGMYGSYGGYGGSYGGGLYGNSLYSGYGGLNGGSGMYGGGMYNGLGGSFGGYGMGMGGPYGDRDPNNPYGPPSQPPGFWVSFLRVVRHSSPCSILIT